MPLNELCGGSTKVRAVLSNTKHYNASRILGLRSQRQFPIFRFDKLSPKFACIISSCYTR